MARRLLNHWEVLAAPAALGFFFLLFFPPSLLLRDEGLTYNEDTEVFTYNRAPVSVAHLFTRCRRPSNEDDVAWCSRLDLKFPFVFAEWRIDAFLLTTPVRECTAEGFSHYQWTPLNRITYKRPEIKSCFNGEDTLIRVTRNLWLFNIFPMLQASRSEFLIERTPKQDPALPLEELESIQRQLNIIQRKMQVTE